MINCASEHLHDSLVLCNFCRICPSSLAHLICRVLRIACPRVPNAAEKSRENALFFRSKHGIMPPPATLVARPGWPSEAAMLS